MLHPVTILILIWIFYNTWNMLYLDLRSIKLFVKNKGVDVIETIGRGLVINYQGGKGVEVSNKTFKIV